jgi:hypothetical protein
MVKREPSLIRISGPWSEQINFSRTSIRVLLKMVPKILQINVLEALPTGSPCQYLANHHDHGIFVVAPNLFIECFFVEIVFDDFVHLLVHIFNCLFVIKISFVVPAALLQNLLQHLLSGCFLIYYLIFFDLVCNIVDTLSFVDTIIERGIMLPINCAACFMTVSFA